MSKAIVVTVGSKGESLGAMKLARWLRRTGWSVTESTKIADTFEYRDFDLYAFSCVFSWKLPALVAMVKLAAFFGGAVWIGGPAVTFDRRNSQYIHEQTGIKPTLGIDDRFEREPGSYPMVYFSRGCPAYTPACGLCPVPRIEGNTFRYYPDATPAPLLLDNNLSALPEDYQQHIINRYTSDYAGKVVDANSGFEPHTFTESTLDRWEKFPLICWRFGYDDLTERDQALEMMRLLASRGYHGKRVRVYTLIGNEPIADCHRRMREVIAAGMEPYPQRLRPLNWLGGALPCRHDWTESLLVAFQRFYVNPRHWRTMRPDEFEYCNARPLAGFGAHQ